MITLKDITYKVNNKILVENVSANFETKKLNLIIGPNGAGKSTLIKIICQQLQPTTGIVYYDNKELTTYSIKNLAQIRAVLSQNIELAFPLKVRELVMMGRYPHFNNRPTPKDEEACDAAMNFFDVSEMADRNYLTLSGGEQQRVHFARIVAQIWYPIPNQSRYLILDEPLTFLDVRYQFDFMNKIKLLIEKENIIVIGVVHDLNLAAKFADYILLLNQGKILAAGNKQIVLSKQNIEQVYKLIPTIYSENENMRIFFD